jgi:hypothetical protein
VYLPCGVVCSSSEFIPIFTTQLSYHSHIHTHNCFAFVYFKKITDAYNEKERIKHKAKRVSTSNRHAIPVIFKKLHLPLKSVIVA